MGNQLESISNKSSRMKDERNMIMPYVIQRIERGCDVDLRDICDLTIDVFFNENSNQGSTLWRTLQLSYLRNLQYSDLNSRKFSDDMESQVEMFVARRVVVDARSNDDMVDLALQKNKIINSSFLRELERDDEMYTLGEVIGFVDITNKPFGLSLIDCSDTGVNSSDTGVNNKRP